MCDVLHVELGGSNPQIMPSTNSLAKWWVALTRLRLVVLFLARCCYFLLDIGSRLSARTCPKRLVNLLICVFANAAAIFLLFDLYRLNRISAYRHLCDFLSRRPSHYCQYSDWHILLTQVWWAFLAPRSVFWRARFWRVDLCLVFACSFNRAMFFSAFLDACFGQWRDRFYALFGRSGVYGFEHQKTRSFFRLSCSALQDWLRLFPAHSARCCASSNAGVLRLSLGALISSCFYECLLDFFWPPLCAMAASIFAFFQFVAKRCFFP